MEYDFSGYVTKNDLLCADGRTIRQDAFHDQNGIKVPFLWEHGRSDPNNVLGHVLLENRNDGVYGYVKLNKSRTAKQARELVRHGDVESFSIYANDLLERAKNVLKGKIREVSLVLAGANPGAKIDNVVVQHGGSDVQLDQEAIIYTNIALEHTTPFKKEDEESQMKTDQTKDAQDSKSEDDALEHTVSDETTVKDVFDSMTPEQQQVVYFMLGEALNSDSNSAVQQSDEASNETDSLQHGEEGKEVKHNIFEDQESATGVSTKAQKHLTHSQIKEIVDDAQKMGSFRESFLQHVATYGIDDIELLFPDAKSIASQPEMLARRTEWVDVVMSGTKHSPFSRIKSIVADITADEARAKGYVTGNLKKEEIIKLLRRKTTPTTIYKKQKLDRDDVVDITDLDVVAWLKVEMRFMLDEEIARAILLGDGRASDDEDKIDEDSIRPIAKDDAMYAYSVTLPSNASVADRIEALIRARSNYRGTGQPVFFTTLPFLTDILLEKDKMGRRIYNGIDAVAAELMVSKVVTVEVMEQEAQVVGIFVNLSDYTIGADKGGEVNMFDDFDIDYNQLKYLMETRISGALTKPRAAVVVKRAAGTLVTPTSPSFDGETNTITFPTITGVVYTVDGVTKTGTLVITETTDVEAHAAATYTFPDNVTTNWTYVYTDNN